MQIIMINAYSPSAIVTFIMLFMMNKAMIIIKYIVGLTALRAVGSFSNSRKSNMPSEK